MTVTTPDVSMRGNNRVRNIVAGYLTQHLPTYIDLMRAENTDIDEYDLPYPKQYLGTDPFDTDAAAYPVVGTYFPNAGSFAKTQTLANGSLEFEVTYSATIFVTVKTPSSGFDSVTGAPIYKTPMRDATVKARDDLLAALRSSILNTPSFGTAGTRYRLVADHNTIRESYPEPYMLNKQNQAWIATGLMNVDIRMTEATANPPIGLVDHIIVGMDQLPFD